MRNLIFISYSHDDKAWLERLQAHLQPLVLEQEVSIWADTEIRSGERFKKEIDNAINSAKIAVLLLSKAFLDSEFILDHELPRLIKAERKKKIKIIWIPIRESSYKTTRLKEIQAAHDPTIPLDSLSQDECEKVLDEISKKIVAAADAPERRKSLTYYANYTPFAVFVLILCVLLINYLSQLLSLNIKFVEVLWGCLGLSVLWITVLGVYAYKAFDSNQPIPAPETFWPLFFGKLATAIGRTERLLTQPKVLIIADNNTQSIAHQIEKEYRGKYLEIEQFICPHEFVNKDLVELLEQSQALYLFLTEETEKRKQLWKIVNKWVVEETHKPVFVVDFLEDDYKLPFTRIPQAKAISGIWKLLAHGNERANIWRLRAKRYWQISSITAMFLILFVFLFLRSSSSLEELKKRDSIQVSNNWEEVKKRDSIDLSNLRILGANLEDTRTLFKICPPNDKNCKLSNTGQQPFITITSDAPEKVKVALDRYASFALLDLMARQGKEGGNIGHLTFWRKFKDEKSNREFIYQVASSDQTQEKDSYCFEDASIIGCAIQQEQFVMWRKSFNNDIDMAWNIKDEPTGRWSATDNAIVFSNGLKCRFAGIDEKGKEPDITGLICLGIQPSGQDVEGSGICLATPQSPDFLANKWTKNYLLRAVSIMRLIPNKLIVPQHTPEPCKRYLK